GSRAPRGTRAPGLRAPSSAPPELAAEVGVADRRPEEGADPAVAIEGDEGAGRLVVADDHAVAAHRFEHQAARRAVAQLLGEAQIAPHRHRPEFAAVLAVVLDKLLLRSEADPGPERPRLERERHWP